MKKLLILGSTGFLGCNISNYFFGEYDIYKPLRSELDLLNFCNVYHYLKYGRFDVILNFANPTGHREALSESVVFERSFRVFTNLIYCNKMYGKMIYIGSGAEYGKHRAITNFSESEFGKELPRDSYGLSRYIMSELAEKSNNIYNLRLFGCYGIGDPPFKLIPHIIRCICKEKSIELKQNALFDFLYVKDIVMVIKYFIENEPKYKNYNLCSGRKIFISDIAAEVRRQMESNLPIVFKQDGYGLEYTGNNERLLSEIPNWKPRSMSEGIKEIIEYENRRI